LLIKLLSLMRLVIGAEGKSPRLLFFQEDF